MKSLSFRELHLNRFGNECTISGVIYSDSIADYLIKFPDEGKLSEALLEIEIDAEGWKDLLRQTDMMETEVLAKAKDGTLTKAIVRKCTRQIEQGVSWRVFRRDGYACRYCGVDDVPLTVDHLVLWEDGGPSIEANLVSSCRKCNKTRSSTPYAEWLNSPYYLKVSKNLAGEVNALNQLLVKTLYSIPRKYHVASR